MSPNNDRINPCGSVFTLTIPPKETLEQLPLLSSVPVQGGGGGVGVAPQSVRRQNPVFFTPPAAVPATQHLPEFPEPGIVQEIFESTVVPGGQTAPRASPKQVTQAAEGGMQQSPCPPK